MSGLTAFLAQNALKIEPVGVIASPRFREGDGGPSEWRIAPINGAEDEELRREATVRRPDENGRVSVAETDYNRYLGLLAARCTLRPDLNDAALQNSYGVLTPDGLLKTMLTAGEYAGYLEKIQEICGFEMEKAVAEAKK